MYLGELSVFYQISPSQDFKNNFILDRMSFNYEEMFVWNASIWVRGPCRYLRIRDIRTFRSILIFFDHGVVVPGLFGKTTPAFVVVLFSKESDRNSLYGPRIMNSITISIQFFRPNTSEMQSFQPFTPLHSNSTKKLDFVIYCECKTNDLLNT